MEQEKIKEIKRVLEEGKYNTIKHHKKEGGCIILSFETILTYINELEEENEVLRKHNIGYHVANGYELQEFAEKIINKLKDKVKSDNVDAFVECKRIIEEVMKERIWKYIVYLNNQERLRMNLRN